MTVESSRSAIQVASAASLLAMAAALGALTVTRSSVVLAAAVAAIVCLSSAALMLVRIGPAVAGHDTSRAAAAAADASFWSYVAALALFSMGSGVAMLEGVEQLKQPHPAAGTGAEPGMVMLALAGATAALALSAWVAATRQSERGGQGALLARLRAAQDPARLTVVIAQSAASIAFAIALTSFALAEVQGVRMADGAGAIAIGLTMAAAAALLAVEVKRIIAADHSETGTDQASDPSLVGVALETKSAEPRPDMLPPAQPQSQPAAAKPQVQPRDSSRKASGKRRR